MIGGLPDVLQTQTFRAFLLAAAGFAAGAVLLFGFIYWQSAGYERVRIETFITVESVALALEPRDALLRDVTQRYADDLHRIAFAAVFDRSGRPLAGDLAALPAGLPVDGRPHKAIVDRAGRRGPVADEVIASAQALPGGDILVIGRSEAELALLRGLLRRALLRGLVPAVLLALICGALLGRRTLGRVAAMNAAIHRIMGGHLGERLPVRGGGRESARRRGAQARGGDVLDQLSAGVNGMLDEIERLLEETRGVGDNIAHDLRTPLTRLRSRLEGGLKRAASREALEQIVAAAITDLDATFATITALLRIGEIDSGVRRSGFEPTRLAPLLEDVVEMWEPLAELRGIALSFVALGSATPGSVMVQADRALLFEAVANLVDNAVKFAPDDGFVELSLLAGDEPVIRVLDSGAGIPQAMRAAMLQRFVRGDGSRAGSGHGLGLALVRAILRIHGFRIVMHEAGSRAGGTGFAVDIVCSEPQAASRAHT